MNTHQQELDDARAEMIFREEQLFVLDSGRINPDARWHMEQQHEAARDRYLALLAEKRIRDLAEICVCGHHISRHEHDGGTLNPECFDCECAYPSIRDLREVTA